MKKVISLILVLVMALSMSVSVYADVAGTIAISSVSATSSKVSFSGTAENVKAAVVVQVCKGTEILAMESFLVSSGAFSGSIDLDLTSGTTYVLKAADYDGGAWVTKEFTYTKPASTSPAASSETLTLNILGGAKSAECTVNIAGQKASVDAMKLGDEKNNLKLSIDLSNTEAKEVEIPAKVMDAMKTAAESLEIKTADAGVLLNASALQTVAEAMNGKSMILSVNTGKDAENKLTSEQAQVVKAIKNPVVINVSIQVGDKTVSDFNGGQAQLTVDYVPDKDAPSASVPRGAYVSERGKRGEVKTVYDPAQGKMTATVEHFSTYVVYLEEALPFKDVTDPTEYFYDPVKWALENTVTSGVSADTFAPASTCTRAQMVTFLWRAAGSPEPTTTTCNFTDVVKGSYYEKAVLWAIEKGITNGTSATTFSPDVTVTRAQAVTFLWRYEGAIPFTNMTANGPAPSPFTDVKTSEYYYNAVLWAKAQGITDGTSATTFSPNKNCSRAEVVTFLYRDIVK